MTTDRTKPMSPREYGRQLAEQAPPLTAEQARAAARILATVKRNADSVQEEGS